MYMHVFTVCVDKKQKKATEVAASLCCLLIWFYCFVVLFLGMFYPWAPHPNISLSKTPPKNSPKTLNIKRKNRSHEVWRWIELKKKQSNKRSEVQSEGVIHTCTVWETVTVTSARLHFDVSTNLSGRPFECCRLFVLIDLGSVCVLCTSLFFKSLSPPPLWPLSPRLITFEMYSSAHCSLLLHQTVCRVFFSLNQSHTMLMLWHDWLPLHWLKASWDALTVLLTVINIWTEVNSQLVTLKARLTTEHIWYY